MRGYHFGQYGFMMRLLSPLLRAFVYIRYLRGKEEAGRLSERFVLAIGKAGQTAE